MKILHYHLDIRINEHDVPVVPPIEGAKLLARNDGTTFVISGNKQGLILLATHLLALAHASEEIVQNGYHIHLDDALYGLNGEQIDFLLERKS